MQRLEPLSGQGTRRQMTLSRCARYGPSAYGRCIDVKLMVVFSEGPLEGRRQRWNSRTAAVEVEHQHSECLIFFVLAIGRFIVMHDHHHSSKAQAHAFFKHANRMVEVIIRNFLKLASLYWPRRGMSETQRLSKWVRSSTYS